MKFYSTVLVLTLSASSALADSPASFYEAKKHLNTIYEDHQVTLYCGCDYYFDGNKKVVDHNACQYETRKNELRANRVEWEHVVPASTLASFLPCWQEGGRKNCTHDVKYNQITNDLHNLVPSVGEINQDRSNYQFGRVRGEQRNYGACDFEVDTTRRIAEPAPNITGDVARIWLYMAERYKLAITPQLLNMLLGWDRKDPPDTWEIVRDYRIKLIQGNSNTFVSNYSRKY